MIVYRIVVVGWLLYLDCLMLYLCILRSARVASRSHSASITLATMILISMMYNAIHSYSYVSP